MEVSRVHPINAKVPILVILDDIVTLVRLVQFLNWLKVIILLLIIAEVRLILPANTAEPILIIVIGIVILVRLLFWNDKSPILVTLDIILLLVILVEPIMRLLLALCLQY